MNMTLVPEIAAEAKALVALAFRNGPIEDLHAGAVCPTCTSRPEFSHISLEECGFRSMWAGDSSGCGHRKRSDVGSDSVLMWAGKSD
jgi:hypothetical protein